ncbi:hypothetical protein K2173_014987 [Erythroxylum novogranatense]|uniref:BZIP domain-containing protein n=1 Tax=Erythroxylum novogranatense TaxID=1862640 RepID=A0AAV8TWG2_9ROSI|nr:hypothetical protein K2173_014987 [Erythroxylum novogranatense]
MSDHVQAGHSPQAEKDFHSLPIPPTDPLYFSSQDDPPHDFLSDLPLFLDDNYDFDITLDDLETLDFPSENEPFVNLDSSSSPDSGSSGISGDHVNDVGKYLNIPLPEAGSCNSGDGSTDFGPTSSQGSRNRGSSGSGVSESMNPNSPDSSNFAVDQKFKVEELSTSKKSSVSKRKKEEEISEEYRNQKSKLDMNADNPSSFVVGNEEDEKKRARLLRNRESAQLSRQRKKHYVEELEEKVKAMHSTITELNNKVSFFMAENVTLRQQLAGVSGMCPPPVYGPVAYPWVPCTPYVVKPHGSQVPLVPIPRLKQQQPISVTKVKKVESKKGERKSKKVASISFLGLLFFVLLFGGLLPIVDVRLGGYRKNDVHWLDFESGKMYDQHRGRILTVHGHSHVSQDVSAVSNGSFDISNGKHCERCGKGCSEYDVEQKGGLDNSVVKGNDSEPLVASLYVPRNDKLVKIDGNLIIHSVLASEKAMASPEAPEMKTKGNVPIIPKDSSLALAIPNGGSNRGIPDAERDGARHSRHTSQDHLKSSAAHGKLQQWFHKDLAGPMLNSGMCSEVFQFDTSPSPGAIVAASSAINSRAEKRQIATDVNKGNHRRTLRGLPLHNSSSDLNITGEQVGSSSHNENLQSNKSAASVVVSVLFDPREAGDGEVDGMIRPKSLSRVFVVVLLDSVKYVTYSCVLPRSGPHLVTT